MPSFEVRYIDPELQITRLQDTLRVRGENRDKLTLSDVLSNGVRYTRKLLPETELEQFPSEKTIILQVASCIKQWLEEYVEGDLGRISVLSKLIAKRILLITPIE